ncbi:uncharacterized protein LOC106161448 [Lingula anatina]|uniref:Uncharacterized protein LOC106161448 n=1 Tax=Lingula anatina TaxID=7574 RepID=A0A1S3I8Z5_LINAN|nr:uncharacterized protein LOC106161448 [Lingula anatina]|eukprot:XP_013393859.1 uncharacterized protein LOC106161448 [Lingula anatina]
MTANNEDLHPETRAYLQELVESGARPFTELTVAEAREAVTARCRVSDQRLDYNFNGQRKEFIVDSPHDPAGVPLWVYTPTVLTADPAILVYFHGGGFTVGDRQAYDTCCKMMATESKCVVVNVEYRLSPEHKFPAVLEDAIVAVKWVKENKEKIGGSSKSKVGVGGDSAGGTVSSSVAHDVTGLAFQILVYPCVNLTIPYPAYVECAEGYGLTTPVVNWYINHWLNNDAEKTDPRASPVLRQKFDHLPPALFIVASHDPLRDDSRAYAKALTDAGVKNETIYFDGVIHAFFNIPGYFRENCQKAYRRIAQFIQENGY